MELSKVHGYDRALHRGYQLEESYREYSYLDLSSSICGVAIGPLTFQIFLQLCRAGSPFLVGGAPFIHDVAFFLFRLSPAYEEARSAKAEARTKVATAATLSRRELLRIARENGLVSPPLRFVIRHSSLVILLEQHAELVVANAFKRSRSKFIERVRGLPFRQTVRAINRFVDRMLFDRPASSGRRNAPATSEPADTSVAADIIHLITGAYGWHRDQVLALPMPEVFQALRKIQRDNPKCKKRERALVHPFATRFTRKHRALASAAAEAAALALTERSAPCS